MIKFERLLQNVSYYGFHACKYFGSGTKLEHIIFKCKHNKTQNEQLCILDDSTLPYSFYEFELYNILKPFEFVHCTFLFLIIYLRVCIVPYTYWKGIGYDRSIVYVL